MNLLPSRKHLIDHLRKAHDQGQYKMSMSLRDAEDGISQICEVIKLPDSLFVLPMMYPTDVFHLDTSVGTPFKADRSVDPILDFLLNFSPTLSSHSVTVDTLRVSEVSKGAHVAATKLAEWVEHRSKPDQMNVLCMYMLWPQELICATPEGTVDRSQWWMRLRLKSIERTK